MLLHNLSKNKCHLFYCDSVLLFFFSLFFFCVAFCFINICAFFLFLSSFFICNCFVLLVLFCDINIILLKALVDCFHSLENLNTTTVLTLAKMKWRPDIVEKVILPFGVGCGELIYVCDACSRQVKKNKKFVTFCDTFI